MLAIFTDEQEFLASTVKSMAGLLGIQNPQELGTFDTDNAWAALAQAGLTGLRARASGRPLGSGVDAMVVAEGLGAMLAPVPYIPSALLATELLVAAGVVDQIDPVSAGQTRFALMLDSRLEQLADVSELGSSVAWGDGEFGLCFDRSGEVTRLATLPLSGFSRSGAADLTASISLGHPRPADGDPVLIGAGVSGEDHDRWSALALTLLCADCVGAMRAAVEGVVAYAKDRIAFGVPIASFQAIQHMCADAYASCEAAFSTNCYAAWAVDELSGREALLAATTAKAWICSVTREVVETVMQVYGGIGQTWEHIAHLYARRAMMDADLLGGEHYQLDRLYALREGAL